MTSQHGYGGSTSWTLGLGTGRVRSVNGIYDTWDLERRLQANGRLQRPLSPAARTKLARLSYAGGGLSDAHERSSKYCWREVERILHDDGAFTGESLDAYALSRLLERAVPGRSFARSRGLAVMLSASLDADHGHDDFGQSQSLTRFVADTLEPALSFSRSDRIRTDHDEFLGGIDVNYQRPVGHRWQLGIRSGARCGAWRKRTARFIGLGFTYRPAGRFAMPELGILEHLVPGTR